MPADEKNQTAGPGAPVEDIDPKTEMENAAVADPGSVDQGPDPEPDDEHVDVIDTITPKAKPKTWTLQQKSEDGEVIEEESYVQRPMNFLAKMKFFALVGEVIDKSISGDDDKEGIRLSSLFELPGERGGQLSASDFREADMFVQGVGKILQYAPDFLEKSYCIWLNIPDFQEDWAISVMNQPADLGGLSDEQGLEIIEIFIDQNWESLESFFREKIASLRDRINQHRDQEEPKEEEKKQLDA